MRSLAAITLLASLAACSNEAGSCEADCARYAVCNDISDCAAWCDTGIALADPGGCADDRRTASACQAGATCGSTECQSDVDLLAACIAARSPDRYQAYCRARETAGCASVGCSGTGIVLDYAVRVTNCHAAWAVYLDCLSEPDPCAADTRCLAEAGAALSCRNAWCSSHTTAPEVCAGP